MERNYKSYEPADIVIYQKDQGTVLKEKSLIAFDSETKKILAVGTDAERFVENSDKNTMVISPLRRGRIVDYSAAMSLFQVLLQKVWGKRTLLRPAIAICVPKGIEEVEKKAAQDCFYQAAKARDVLIVEQPYEQFIVEMSEEIRTKYRTVIGITKEEPERYLREMFLEVQLYAKQENISLDRAAEIFAQVCLGSK